MGPTYSPTPCCFNLQFCLSPRPSTPHVSHFSQQVYLIFFLPSHSSFLTWNQIFSQEKKLPELLGFLRKLSCFLLMLSPNNLTSSFVPFWVFHFTCSPSTFFHPLCQGIYFVHHSTCVFNLENVKKKRLVFFIWFWSSKKRLACTF